MSEALDLGFPECPSTATSGFQTAFERDWERLNDYHALHINKLNEVVEIDPLWRLPDDFDDRLNRFGLADETESPIEYHMMRAMLLSGALDHDRIPPIVMRARTSPIKGIRRTQIIPQLSVGIYRLDFAVCYWSYGAFARVAVECDGQAYHAMNQEQVDRDKKRDRYLMQHGWPVLRFTGSEIAQDAISRSHEVGAALSGLQWDVVCAYRAGLAALHRKQRGLDT